MSDAKGDSYLEIESNVRILSLSIETDRLTITPSGTLQCRHHSIRAFHVFAVEQATVARNVTSPFLASKKSRTLLLYMRLKLSTAYPRITGSRYANYSPYTQQKYHKKKKNEI